MSNNSKLKSEDKAFILDNLNNLKAELPKITNKALRDDLSNLFSMNLSDVDDAGLKRIIQSSTVHAGFQAVVKDKELVQGLYSKLEVTPEAIPDDMSTPGNGPLDFLGGGGTAGMATLGGIALALLTAKKGDSWGDKIKSALKMGALGGGAGLALDNKDDILGMFAPMLKGLEPMGEGLGDLLKSGAGGIGGFTEAMGDWFKDAAKDPKQFFGIAGIVAAAAMGFKKGLGGGVFTALFTAAKYAALTAVAMWVAPSLLEAIGVDTSKFSGQSQGLVADAPTPANSLPSTASDNLQLSK